MIKIDDCYVIMSDDGCLIAKGATKQRCLLHIKEMTKKTPLLYNRADMALNLSKNFPMELSSRAFYHAVKRGWINEDDGDSWDGIKEHLVAVACDLVIKEGGV